MIKLTDILLMEADVFADLSANEPTANPTEGGDVDAAVEDALDDIDNWEENEHTSIKQNIYLIQENINLWKMNTTEDSDDENY